MALHQDGFEGKTELISEGRKQVVSIHQPNYLPWLGYFHKIYCSDVFVFHDNIEYSKKTLLRRVHIRKNLHQNEKAFLTVPIRRHSDFSNISDLTIDHTQPWIQKQINRIRAVYSTAPYFHENFDFLRDLVQSCSRVNNLDRMNESIIKGICAHLSINAEFRCSSEAPFNSKGSEYNALLTKYYGGDIYFSGGGSSEYQNKDDFVRENIELVIQEWSSFILREQYKQHQGDFINGLSVVDSLFNIGVQGILNLFHKYAMEYGSTKSLEKH